MYSSSSIKRRYRLGDDLINRSWPNDVVPCSRWSEFGVRWWSVCCPQVIQGVVVCPSFEMRLLYVLTVRVGSLFWLPLNMHDLESFCNRERRIPGTRYELSCTVVSISMHVRRKSYVLSPAVLFYAYAWHPRAMPFYAYECKYPGWPHVPW